MSVLVVSANEVDALARKAAKGAGMPWGLAADAGKATRWLADHGLPGPPVLLDLLDWRDGRSMDAVAPPDVSFAWAGHAPVLDAVVVGTVCADLADRSAGGSAELGTVRCPLLLGFAVAVVARHTGLGLVACWGEAAIGVAPGAVAVRGASADLCVPEAAVTLRPGPLPGEPLLATGHGCCVDVGVWERLERYAGRTYAPDTEQSRLTGAGAGLIDD